MTPIGRGILICGSQLVKLCHLAYNGCMAILKLAYCKNCLQVLSDPTRTKVIDILARKSPQTVNSIVEQFELRQPTISHHLKLLRKEKFVTYQKQGNQVLYSLNLYCHRDTSHKCYLLQKVSASQRSLSSGLKPTPAPLLA